ncbi:MAG: redoxin domain-containing protein [Muribaculaceae bacterium]|nr:redoxin domain-containing protein [Muribaculaceae bacterium]
MKKTFLLIALAAGILLFAGEYAAGTRHTTPGMSAPALELREADSTVARDRLHGDYVLLCFWSTLDAVSRRDANLYTAWSRSHPDAPLKVIGVNFDDSQGLFREIVRLDSLEADNQFHVSGDTAEMVARNYGLEQGYGSTLVAPDGKIVAINPQVDNLAALVPAGSANRGC